MFETNLTPSDFVMRLQNALFLYESYANSNTVFAAERNQSDQILFRELQNILAPIREPYPSNDDFFSVTLKAKNKVTIQHI